MQSVCKANKWKDHLTTYMRTKTGEKPYPYRQYDKAFSKKEILKTFIRIHVGDKKHNC